MTGMIRRKLDTANIHSLVEVDRFNLSHAVHKVTFIVQLRVGANVAVGREGKHTQEVSKRSSWHGTSV